MRVFEEEQKFTQAWLMIVLIVGLITPVLAIINQWTEKQDKSISANLDSLFAIIVLILVVTFILIAKLKTRIDNEGIKYQFFPFHLKYKLIYWNEIKTIYVRKYNAILEYGGWGYKGVLFSKSRGTALNVSGNLGFQIILKSENKLLIGTQLKEKAEQVLNYYKNKEND